MHPTLETRLLGLEQTARVGERDATAEIRTRFGSK